jgi:hypothetical protein
VLCNITQHKGKSEVRVLIIYSTRHFGNMSFETVEHFKRLETNLTTLNSIHEEINNKFKPGNLFYYSVQNLLCSSLLFKNRKIKIHITIILSVFKGVKLGLSY